MRLIRGRVPIPPAGETPGVFTSYDFTADVPADFVTAWGGPTSGNPCYEDLASRFKGTTAYGGGSKLIRFDRHGLRMEPAATNEATNPRMEGATSATLNSASADQACTVTATSGSYVYTVNMVAHGRSDFDRVYFPVAVTVGGRTLSAGSAPANANAAFDFSIFNVTANTFDIYYWQAATSSGTSAATNFRYRTWATTGTLPTGQSIAAGGAATRLIRLINVVAPSGTPAMASQRVYNIAGTGTSYLVLQNVACAQGQDLAFSQVAHLLYRRQSASPPNNDDQSIANITIGVAFVEKDGGASILRETVIDQTANMTVAASQMRMAAYAQTQHASCASVDVCIKFSGATGCDHNFEMREFMISKSIHCASPVLPNTGSTGSVSKVAETCADVTAIKTIRGADYTFECKEIVAATDTIISFGNVELQAIGTTWPRDLRLTDGTNSVTLSGALRDLWTTQQTVRAAMSFGSSGLVLAVTDDFVTATASGSNASYAGGSPTTLRLNESSAGTRRAMTTAKGLKLYNAQRNSAACVLASKLTAGVSWAVPGVDTAVGRTSVVTLKVPPASGSFDSGKMSITTGRIFILAPAAGTVIEDWDFRGCYILTNAGSVNNVTFRNCLFDQTSTLAAYSFSQNGLTTVTGWIIENCDFTGGATTAYSAFFSMTSTGVIVRKCRFIGANSDTIQFINACTVEDCILVQTNATTLGAHADAMEVNKADNQALTVQRLLVDFRKVYGVRVEPNTAISANPGNNIGNFAFAILYKDIVCFGGNNQVDMNAGAPGTNVTTPGLMYGDASVTLDNLQVGLSPGTPVDAVFNQRQLVFSGAAVTFANVAGRTYCQNLLGLLAGSYSAGWRAGGIRGPSKAQITTATAINALETALANGDTFSINGNNIAVVTSGAAGDNQINVSDSIATLITKMQNLVPGLTVTFSDFQFSKTVTDYFSGAAL